MIALNSTLEYKIVGLRANFLIEDFHRLLPNTATEVFKATADIPVRGVNDFDANKSSPSSYRSVLVSDATPFTEELESI
jgi:hypothetical protein